jgi:anaerobic selenocysteine-containing dehydrogenase
MAGHADLSHDGLGFGRITLDDALRQGGRRDERHCHCGPEPQVFQLAIDAAGNPLRIDKAFSWENPLSAHGLMHMLIPNAHAGDPYRIDTLFLYMANMAWNSSMNTAEVMRMLTDKDDSGEYVIPRII